MKLSHLQMLAARMSKGSVKFLCEWIKVDLAHGSSDESTSLFEDIGENKVNSETIEKVAAHLMKEYLEHVKSVLEPQGYWGMKLIEGRGICGLGKSMFTTDLYYELDEHGWVGKYMYQEKEEAEEALANWGTYVENPAFVSKDPSGPWIKHKGEYEYSNPEVIFEPKTEE